MSKWLWFGISIVIISVDQLTKLWAATHLSPYDPIHLMPMVSFTLAYNTGAAFSFLSGAGGWHQWFFVAFSSCMSIFLIIWIKKAQKTSYMLLMALSFILGGALGNLIDRLFYGHVIDFIDVYYKQYHWPVFNIADSAICIGAFLLLLDLLRKPD